MSAAALHWVENLEAPVDADGLGAHRGEALARFRERGFPTRREEAWKYTNPARITEGAYGPAPESGLDEAAREELRGVVGDGPRFVFVNGRISKDDSTALDAGLPGLQLRALGPRFEDIGSAERALLASAPPLTERAFAQLADAFFHDALLLRSEARARLEVPLTLVFASVGEGPSFASFPRVVVAAERESSLRVREVYWSPGNGDHLCNAFSQYHVAEGASLERETIQLESPDATFLSAAALCAERDARIRNRAIALGARLAREDLVCTLAGSGAECDLTGLYLTAEGQHSDHHTTVDHSVPQCASRQLYRGVLGGRSRGAFTGTVIVREGAQQSDAQQKNESLLLSERAEADTKPQLEIYADDVKCSHGSTIGQLDPDALFYLRSRGIGEEDARALLIRGFASAITGDIDLPVLREAIDRHVNRTLRARVSA